MRIAMSASFVRQCACMNEEEKDGGSWRTGKRGEGDGRTAAGRDWLSGAGLLWDEYKTPT